MKRALFLPTARQTNWLLVIGFLALGQALYLRYMALENNTVSLACQGGLRTWLCDTFRLTIVSVQSQRLRLGGARRRRAQSVPAVDRAGDAGARRGGLRHRAAQRRSRRPRGRPSHFESGTSRARSRMTPRPAIAGAEPDRLPIGKAFVDRRCSRPRRSALRPPPSRRRRALRPGAARRPSAPGTARRRR